jgi:hypothetical protein
MQTTDPAIFKMAGRIENGTWFIPGAVLHDEFNHTAYCSCPHWQKCILPLSGEIPETGWGLTGLLGGDLLLAHAR